VGKRTQQPGVKRRERQMGTYTFTVDEPLMGFIAHAQPWSDKAKRYVAWKGKVRLFADLAGVPEEIPENHRAIISICVAWKKRARIDLSNILKGIEDGMFVKDRGIGEFHAIKIQHTGLERVSVTVGFEREKGNSHGVTKQNRKQQA